MPAKVAAKASTGAKAAPAPKAGAKKAATAPAGKAAGKVAGKVAGKAAGKVAAKPAAPAAPKVDPRCVRPPKHFGIGGDLPPKGKIDVTRFVRWPRYVWRQRRVRILQNRLKTPPAINQFSKVLDADPRKELFRLAQKYAPESKKERAQRLKAIAAAKATKNKDAAIPPKKVTLRCGLKCVTRLIEHKRAKLVIIAHDVTPLELVLYLPALCRKQGIPYVIVKGKALLGKLVGFKTAAVVAFEKINSEDSATFERLLSSIATSYDVDTSRRQWGGLTLGRASQDKLRAQKEKARKAELAKSNALKQ